MSDGIWRDADAYLEDRLVVEDEALSAAIRDSAAAGLPPIAVSAAQGKMLHLTALPLAQSAFSKSARWAAIPSSGWRGRSPPTVNLCRWRSIRATLLWRARTSRGRNLSRG